MFISGKYNFNNIIISYFLHYIDNSIYSKLLICGLTESIFMFSTNLLVCICYLPQYYFIFKILNKVLYSIYIVWLSILFIYIYRISDTNKNELKQSISF